MHIIELKILKLLQDIKNTPYKIPDELLAKFGKETQQALQKQFERDPREFRLSMSNVGRPTCQLQWEAIGYSGNRDIVRNLYGDICEDILLFLIYASGLKVVSELGHTSVNVNGTVINGEYDLILDLEDGNGPSVWDIKSSSDWAFKNKWKDFDGTDLSNDPFGYITQLFLYAEGTGTSPGGWIVQNKSSGEISVVSLPQEYKDKLRGPILELVGKTITRVDAIRATTKGTRTASALGGSIDKYENKPEFFQRKATGNIILDDRCVMCPFKFNCWPDLIIKPQAKSKAKNPKLQYYITYKEAN